MINQIFDRVVVINLNRRDDRLKQITQDLNSLGIKFERFAAIDNGDPIDSCKQSHLAVISQAREDNLGSILILEDDALFSRSFLDDFQKAYSELPNDWDMFYLGGSALIKLPFSRYLVRSKRTLSLQAYAVSSKAYDILLRDYPGHIDVGYSLLHDELQVFLARPSIVKQHPGYSDIRCRIVNDLHVF